VSTGAFAMHFADAASHVAPGAQSVVDEQLGRHLPSLPQRNGAHCVVVMPSELTDDSPSPEHMAEGFGWQAPILQV
jgi:hypothetical protein